jgi:microcystin-dependent protein
MAMEAFIGTMLLFGGSYAPQGWLECSGQTLGISQNTALFAIIGTTYGGDGTTTFMLPDMRQNTVPAGAKWILCLNGIFPARN